MTRMSVHLSASALALALAGFAPARVAEVEIVAGAGTPLTLEVGNGQLLRLDRPAASVFVANPEVADVEVVSPRLIYVFARRAGATNLLAVAEGDQLIANVALSVMQNMSQAQAAISAVAPTAVVTPVGQNAALLTGVVGTPVEASSAEAIVRTFVPDPDLNVINQTQVTGPTQVNLQVRVAEVSRDAVEQLGINWESVLRAGDFIFGLATGRDFVDAAGDFATEEGRFQIVGGFRDEDSDVNVLIDALEQQNLLSILAEPNLTALSGETASFLAGGEFPIPVPQEDNTIAIEYRSFGVALTFTPTVLGPNRLSLRVRPEVSQLTDAGSVTISGFVIPGLATRRAETTVELASGQSFAIAGLFQSNTNRNLNQFPFLGDVPVLGALFRSAQFQRAETELVIVVTPYLVQPVEQPLLAAPTDRIAVPDEVLTGAGPGLTTPAPTLAASRPGFTGFILK